MRALPETWQLLDGLLKCPIGDVRIRPAHHSQVHLNEKLLTGVSGALQRPGSTLSSDARGEGKPVLLFKGQIERIGSAPHMSATNANGVSIAEKRWSPDAKSGHEALFD